MTTKRSRIDYTLEQVEVLEAAWSGGMKHAGKQCHEKIKEIANSLEISVERVREWIGNRNSKARVQGGGRPIQKKRSIAKGTNAYSLFAKTFKRGAMDGPTYMKVLSEKWGQLPEEEKEIYKNKAREIRDDPYKGQPTEDVISSQLKVINQACEHLDSVGYDICGMGIDRDQQSAPALFGSSNGLKFLDMDVQDRFRLFLKGKLAVHETSTVNKNMEQKELRQRVRQHFNTSWTNSTNLKSALPYKELMDGNVEVDGLPDGVKFKDPSCYGSNTLKALMGCQITFKIRSIQTYIIKAVLDYRLQTL